MRIHSGGQSDRVGPDLTDGFATGAALVRKPHDDYLEAYARLGVFGLAAYVLVIISAVVPSSAPLAGDGMLRAISSGGS